MPDLSAPSDNRPTTTQHSFSGLPLSEREAHLLTLVANGLNIPRLVTELHITSAAVTATLNRIRKKVGGSAQHTLLDRAYRTGQLPAPTPTAPPPGTELSAEQRRILQLQAGGATAEQIAAALVVSDSTASNRIRAIHTALGAHSAAEAVRRGWELGYLHREEPPATAGTA